VSWRGEGSCGSCVKYVEMAGRLAGTEGGRVDMCVLWYWFWRRFLAGKWCMIFKGAERWGGLVECSDRDRALFFYGEGRELEGRGMSGEWGWDVLGWDRNIEIHPTHPFHIGTCTPFLSDLQRTSILTVLRPWQRPLAG